MIADLLPLYHKNRRAGWESKVIAVAVTVRQTRGTIMVWSGSRCYQVRDSLIV